MSTIAIMQPYFLPYIGYWQLMACVDRFVLLDDVTYIKQGWINRNRILVNGKAHFLTIPLANASSNTRICDLRVSRREINLQKFRKTVQCAYRKAPFFESAYNLFEEIMGIGTDDFSTWLLNSITALRNYLGIENSIVLTSRYYKNDSLRGVMRVLDICRTERADRYINPIGGIRIYNRREFQKGEVELLFIKTKDTLTYRQFGDAFFPSLSILDVLMFNSSEETRQMLTQFELTTE